MAKPIKKERTNRTVDQSDSTFYPYTVTPETAHTAVLLLDSYESEILCQTLRAISHFASQSTGNLLLLFELSVLPRIIQHIDRTELNLQRFVMKLFAQICEVPQSIGEVLKNEDIIPKLLGKVTKMEDVFVLEFALQVLSLLTEELKGCEQITTQSFMQPLFARLKHDDPDVQKNSLQILCNLIDDLVSVELVVNNVIFAWGPILDLLTSKYVALQKLAIQTVDHLLRRVKDIKLQESFRDSPGIQILFSILEDQLMADGLRSLQQGNKFVCYTAVLVPACRSIFPKEVTLQYKNSFLLFDFIHSIHIGRSNKRKKESYQKIILSKFCENFLFILQCYEYLNVHLDVFNLLKNFVEIDDNVAHLHKLGCELNLQLYINNCSDVEKPSCLAVLTRMSNNPVGREVLYETNSDIIFCNLLLGSNATLYGDAALAVANMCEIKASANRMMETNVIEALTVILGDDALPWFDVKLNCIKALRSLGKISVVAVKMLMESKTFLTLRSIILKGCAVSMEILHLILRTYMTFQGYYICEEKMIDKSFMKELVLLLSCNDIQLKILVCETLCGIMVNIKAQNLLNEVYIEAALADLLKIDHYGLRTAACQLITLSVNKSGALKYVDKGTVQYMVKNKDIRMKCHAWETAIETILKNHLSAKFAYIGRIEINERTTSGFYVTRRLQPKFLTLERLHSAVSSPRSPVYVCNFASEREDLQSASVDDYLVGTNASSRVKNSNHRKASISNSSLQAKTQELADVLLPDPYLKQYLGRLKSSFSNNLSSERSTVASCIGLIAEILAQFVETQMCGLTVERNCSRSSVEIHINELKLALSSSIIPLGYVRVGGHLERSLLFKVLADQIGLPCALVRSTFGLCWCEVALPDSVMNYNIDVEYYPAYLLRPNYVVDLFNAPGRLLPIGSAEAAIYCDQPRSQPYVTIPRPLGEQCLCHEDVYNVKTIHNRKCDN